MRLETVDPQAEAAPCDLSAVASQADLAAEIQSAPFGSPLQVADLHASVVTIYGLPEQISASATYSAGGRADLTSAAIASGGITHAAGGRAAGASQPPGAIQASASVTYSAGGRADLNSPASASGSITPAAGGRASGTSTGEVQASASATYSAGGRADLNSPASASASATQSADGQAAGTSAAGAQASATQSADGQAAGTSAAGAQSSATQSADGQAAGTSAAGAQASATQAADGSAHATSAGGGGGPNYIDWTDEVNAADTGMGTLTRTGSGGRAGSTATFSGAADYSIQFMAGAVADGLVRFGVFVAGSGVPGTFAGLDYYIWRSGTNWRFYAAGSQEASGTISGGEVLKAAVEGGVLKFYIDDVLTHTSSHSPAAGTLRVGGYVYFTNSVIAVSELNT